MFRREDYLKTVSDFLARLELSVRNRGFAKLLDINVVAETFFAHFLSELYGLRLVNLNVERGNSPSIDLGDKKRRVAFQVTSTNSKAKIQGTIKKFADHGLANEYDTLNILIIGSRQRTYNKIDTHGVNFNSQNNIVDIRGIIKQLQSLETSKLKTLNGLIENESPILTEDARQPIKLWLSEDTHECYFNIPSYNDNDSPPEGRLSYTFFRFVIKVCFPNKGFIDKIDVHLYKPLLEYIGEVHDTGEAALYHSIGQQMGQAIEFFVERNPPFHSQTLEPGLPTRIVLPKYAHLDSKIFHKSHSPFYAVLIIHCGMQFVRLLCRLPLMGTGVPKLSTVCEKRSEFEMESLVEFARRAYKTNQWTNSIEFT